MNKLYVVGIGPGKKEGMTLEALQALEQCDCIVGYSVYNELVKVIFPEKEYLTTGMTKEIDRVQLAIEKAAAGEKTALVCSGDAEVYGLAGLVCELNEENIENKVEIEVVAGVSAAFSGGALLGAPLGHDFAVISLSDLLTPWSVIEKRLIGAAVADFVLCLYNPASKKRADYLQKACDICLRYKPADTVCGLAHQVGREGESFEVLTLGQLRDTTVDMFTTVYIGNSETRVIDGRMVTPRGYRIADDPSERMEQAGKKELAPEKEYAIENAYVPYQIDRDEEFLRNVETTVPMTKYPVRVLTVNELMLTPDAIVYDIGAGTGSVTVEMAKRTPAGRVYAIEKKEEAVAILKENVERFAVKNVQILHGSAPEAMKELPAPDCVFIGGSSGELKQIVRELRAKNPEVRIVVTAITLETVALLLEIAREIPEYADMQMMQLSATNLHRVAGYHMQHANNPVYLASFGGPCQLRGKRI